MEGHPGSRQSAGMSSGGVPSMGGVMPLNALAGFGFPPTGPVGVSPGVLTSSMHGGPPGVYPSPPSMSIAMSPVGPPPPQLFLPGGQYSVVPPALSPPRSVGQSGAVSNAGGYSPLQSPGLGGASSLAGYSGSLSAANGVGAAGAKLTMGRHLCAICEDAASGKHYGVYSCEGCKGFFKRTVRKDLRYTCRENNNCIVDKRQRNRCQACRYQRCLQTGMKREAVQEERLTALEKAEMEAESTTMGGEMPIESILSAEMRLDTRSDGTQGFDDLDSMPAFALSSVADQLCGTLVDWAVAIPHFAELPTEDQLMLLKTGWNELLIASFAHRSTAYNECLMLSPSLRLSRGLAAEQVGISAIYDRILTDLVAKMRAMGVDRIELGCLRVIILFNPDAKGLQAAMQVESLREKVYLSLEEYCRRQYPDDPGRFAKLLLRLPALRSIGLKCPNYLFLSQPCRAEVSSVENYIGLLLKSMYIV